MAGPALTHYLAGRDYAAFQWIMRQFAHDVTNRLSPITTECSIITRMLERIPIEEIFIDPTNADQIPLLVGEASVVMDYMASDKVRALFWPPGDTEGINRKRWMPYDADAWDRVTEEIAQGMMTQSATLVPLINRLAALAENKLINPEGRGRVLLTMSKSLPGYVNSVVELFMMETWETILPEWLERQKAHAEEGKEG